MIGLVEEDVSRRTIALSVKAGKLTARTLAQAVQAAGRALIKAHGKPRRGKQTVRQLMSQGAATSSIPVDAPEAFDRVARRFNVDYAFYQSGPGEYLLFFKSSQADAITACFGEYSRRMLKQTKEKQAPVKEQMNQGQEKLKEQLQKPRQKERAKEVGRADR